MIGRITDVNRIIPLDVYVQHHYNWMVYSQTENYMRGMCCDRYEEYKEYLTKELAKLRKINDHLETENMNAQKEIPIVKHNIDWNEGHINRVINRIKNSNKMPILEFQDWHLSIIRPIGEEKWNDELKIEQIENKLNEKLTAELKSREDKHSKWIADLGKELRGNLRVAKIGIKRMMGNDIRPYIRKNAEKIANHVSIFSKDDDRFNKVKARHNLSKLYLTSILEKTKEEKAKLVKLYGEKCEDTENNSKLWKLYFRYCDDIKELCKKREENDKIKVECKELEMRVNNIFNPLCKRKLIKVLNELREQKAKAEQKYEDTYAKWDIISENRATLLGNLHKLTTDNINLQIECLILQFRIDFCNMHNPLLESIAGGRLGFDYL